MGGLLSNFPLWLFDGDRVERSSEPIPVVGFKMVGKTEGKSARISSCFLGFGGDDAYRS